MYIYIYYCSVIFSILDFVNQLYVFMLLFECFSTSQPDIYGLINILYLKADVNRDGHITQDELSGVFTGFDSNGVFCSFVCLFHKDLLDLCCF